MGHRDFHANPWGRRTTGLFCSSQTWSPSTVVVWSPLSGWAGFGPLGSGTSSIPGRVDEDHPEEMVLLAVVDHKVSEPTAKRGVHRDGRVELFHWLAQRTGPVGGGLNSSW